MMNLFLIIKLSLRHFFTRDNKGSHHLRGAAAGIGIAIIPVIIVFIAGNGLIEGITERFQELSSGQMQIRGMLDRVKSEGLVDELNNTAGIYYAGEVLEEYGLVTHNGINAGTVIRGLPKDIYEKDEGFRKNLSITAGEFDLTSNNTLLMSAELAKKLKVVPGDEIKLIIHRTFGSRTLYRPVRFTVNAVFKTGYYELDSTTVYISRNRVYELFGSAVPRYILIKADQKKLKPLLSELSRTIDSNCTIMPWYHINSSMYENFASTKSSLMIIMLLIVAIAGLSVSSSVYMLVMEQKEEIAFLKAIGMNNNTISRVFILSGAITGLIGGGTGILAGLLTGIHINEILRGIERVINALNKWLHYLVGAADPKDYLTIVGGDFYLDRIPVIIKPEEILLIFSVGIIVSIIGAMIPSVKAAKIPPLEMIAKK